MAPASSRYVPSSNSNQAANDAGWEQDLPSGGRVASVSTDPAASSHASTDSHPSHEPRLRLSEVARSWLPLAASWAVMGLELPLVSAVMARLMDPEVHLAAYGGVVFPVALVVEAPVIMLLAASVALGRDMAAYRLLFRFMFVSGAALTALHALLAFTPLFDLIIVPLLGPPEAVIEPARLGLKIMLPWTWAIGYRRFNQGLLIRFERSHHVSIGTGLRLAAVAGTAITAALLGAPGIVVAASAIAVGVTVEALYSAWAVKPVVGELLPQQPPVDPPLKPWPFTVFYVPLVLTSLLSLLVQPIGSAAIARMPDALASLAVWPVVSGLLFILRAPAMALNEVVVALLDRPGAYAALRRFTFILSLSLLLLTAAVAFTPLSSLWFKQLSGLNPELSRLATLGFAFALFWPALDGFRNLLQGVAVYSNRTASISASMVVFLVVTVSLLAVGVALQRFAALPVAILAFFIATLMQVAWLGFRVRPEIAKLAKR